MKHIIKCWPQYFCRVADGSKTFEVRVNDRGYQPGDNVVLEEWDPTEIEKTQDTPQWQNRWMEARGYSGRKLEFSVGYVLPIDDKRVVFSLLPKGAADEC